MINPDIELIRKAVLAGELENAVQIAKQVSFEELHPALEELAAAEQNIAVYGFYAALIAESPTAEFHYAAAELLATALNAWQGAYPLAFYHARKAAEAAPEDISLQEFLLFFNAIPDRLLSDADAKKIAAEILKKDPENKAAQKAMR
jgi:hypothetical protein